MKTRFQAVLFLTVCGAGSGGLAEAQTATCPIVGPEAVVSGLEDSFQIRVDDGFVYYFNHPPNVGLYRSPKAGGGEGALLGAVSFASVLNVEDYAFDGSGLYLMSFGDDSNPSPDAGAIIFSGKDGSDARWQPIGYPDDCRTNYLLEIATAGDGAVYFLEEGTTRAHFDCTAADGARSIARLDPGASTPTVVAQVSSQAKNLEVDGAHVFWTDETGVWRQDRDGAPAERIFASASSPVEMAIDPDNIYFHDGAATYRIAAPGSAVEILDRPFLSLRSDGAFVYGLVPRGPGTTDATLARMKPNGHGFTFLARAGMPSTFWPNGHLAVDDTFVYTFDSTRTKIMRVCK